MLEKAIHNLQVISHTKVYQLFSFIIFTIYSKRHKKMILAIVKLYKKWTKYFKHLLNIKEVEGNEENKKYNFEFDNSDSNIELHNDWKIKNNKSLG